MSEKKLEMAGSSSEEETNQPTDKKQITLLPEDQERFGLLVNQFKEAEDLGDAADVLEEINAFLNEAVEKFEAEERKRMELVESPWGEIHRFEREALEQIVESINEDYAEQRLANPDFNVPDVNLAGLDIGVKDHSVVNFKYFNKPITRIPRGLNELVNLHELHMSNTNIERIEGIDALVNLKVLSLSQTKIRKIQGLDHLVNLEMLLLGSNKISKIEGLEALIRLWDLQLSRTDISKIEGLESLVNLQRLNLNGTNVSEIEGLDALARLQELYLSRTKIRTIEGLNKLLKLQRLYINDTLIPPEQNQPELDVLKNNGVQVFI
jgi:Leucine-rich repeat (LRR) protein